MSIFLEYLKLDSNVLRGSFPIGLSKLKNLKTFSICCNDFDGSLPDDFFSTTSLESINLSDNSFIGSFLAHLPPNSKLTEFYATYNMFSGTLPNWITEAKNLKTVSEFVSWKSLI